MFKKVYSFPIYIWLTVLFLKRTWHHSYSTRRRKEKTEVRRTRMMQTTTTRPLSNNPPRKLACWPFLLVLMMTIVIVVIIIMDYFIFLFSWCSLLEVAEPTDALNKKRLSGTKVDLSLQWELFSPPPLNA